MMILTHLSRMEFPTLVSWTSSFPLKAFWVVFFILVKFKLNFLQANNVDPDQTPHKAASDLDLHCLPLSHKKDAMLLWVTLCQGLIILPISPCSLPSGQFCKPFCRLLIFFFKIYFSKNSIGNTIRVSNCLDPDHWVQAVSRRHL